MSPVRVVSDSTHYFPPEAVAALRLETVSLSVHRAEASEREIDITDSAAFYDSLRGGADLPTTSQPSIGDFLAVYEPLLAAGDDVVSIHISGAVSGTYGSAGRGRAPVAG